jgi:hypothetical protein
MSSRVRNELPYIIKASALQRGARRIKKLAGLICILALFLLALSAGSVNSMRAAYQSTGKTFLVFGPADYKRAPGQPLSVTRSFNARNANAPYTLRIFNGGNNNQFSRTSSATVTLNGVEVATTQDFNQDAALIERRVALTLQNTLIVELRGAPGSGMSIEIAGIDLDPPTIGANTAPPPNAAGWNFTDVKVSFACTDELSGIASCPPPLTVSTEGANQPVSGTATDRAGNMVRASLTLNIDKTPPSLSLASPADQAVVETSAISLTGTAADSLSGIDEIVCNDAPASISGAGFSCRVGLAEGINSIKVQARDRAGNFSSHTMTVTSVVPRPVGPDGGTIVALGGRVQLEIPPGALEQVTAITIRPLPQIPGDPLSNTAFDFGPDGTRFLRPVALTLSYNPEGIPPNQAASLRIIKQFSDDIQRLMPPGAVDTGNHTVTAEIQGFSSYRVTIQCSDPAAVCFAPPELTARYMEGRTINLTWIYRPLQPIAPYVEIERAVVRGGAPCAPGTPHCVCDSDGCRLDGLQTPHDADYTHVAWLNSSTTTYTDSNITSDSAFYYYRIRWLSTLVSPPSEPARVIVFGLSDPPPDPVSLTATALPCGAIELTWPLVSDLSGRVAPGEDVGYVVERVLPDGSFLHLTFLPSQDFVPGMAAAYTDARPKAEGATYTYRVVSVAGSLRSSGNTMAAAIASAPCSDRASILLLTRAEHVQRNVEWVGVRDGSGPWRRVFGTNGWYSFDVMTGATEGRYSVAVVCQSGLQVEGRILELTTDDPRIFNVTCSRQGEARNHSVTVNARNVPAFTCVTGAAGVYQAAGCQPNSWTASVFTDNYDLVTVARNIGNSAASRIAIAHNISVSGPRVFELESDLATAVVAEPHEISVTGASGTILTRVDFLTAGGTRALLGSGGGTSSYGGLPEAAQASGDIHRAVASTIDGPRRRSVYTYFTTPIDLVVDFSSLPAMFPDPTVQIAGRVPYLRISTDFFGSATFLPNAAGYEIQYQSFNSSTDSSQTWRVLMSRSWLASQPRMYELPDFRSAPGWQSNWELANTATSINWVFTAHTTNGDDSTFLQSIFSPLNGEGFLLPNGFVRREFSVSDTVR